MLLKHSLGQARCFKLGAIEVVNIRWRYRIYTTLESSRNKVFHRLVQPSPPASTLEKWTVVSLLQKKINYISHKLCVRMDGTQFYDCDGLQPKMTTPNILGGVYLIGPKICMKYSKHWKSYVSFQLHLLFSIDLRELGPREFY